MPKCLFNVMLVLFSAADAFAGGSSECTRNIPVTSHFYSAHVVHKGESCELNSNYAYDSAQNVMVMICASLRGHYRAEAQTVMCDSDAVTLKVAKGPAGFIEV